jgi:TonB family protein
MNRLQKKCVIVTAGVHLLLLLILIVGPAFFSPKPKEDDLQVLDVIPANLIDAPFNSGVANAQPPPPVPAVTPPVPVPVVTPPEPVPPKVEPPKPVIKDPEKALTPTEKPKEVHKPQISTQLVTRPTSKASPDANKANDAARARAIRNALRKLKNNLTSATTVDMPGDSSVAYANYASAVKSIYDEAWTLPDHIANDEEITKASVTIASDGTVITARIVTPSGDENVDASVQRALERVKSIAPFPEGSTDKERTYIINFNPKTKQMLE